MKRCGRLLKEVKRRSAHLLRGGLQPRAGGRRVPAARRKPPCRDPRARVAGAVSAVPIAARAVVVASVPGQAAASRPCPPPRLPAAAPRPRPGLGSGFLGSGWSLTGCGGGLGRFFFFLNGWSTSTFKAAGGSLGTLTGNLLFEGSARGIWTPHFWRSGQDVGRGLGEPALTMVQAGPSVTRGKSVTLPGL